MFDLKRLKTHLIDEIHFILTLLDEMTHYNDEKPHQFIEINEN